MLNKRNTLFLCASMLIFSLLFTSCSSGGPQPTDLPNLAVQLTTSPSPPKAKETSKLIADFTGAPSYEKATVSFDIRRDGLNRSESVDAKPEGNGRFTAEKSFSESGKYTVYIHFQQGDIHSTKKKFIEVVN